jgi:hypothetical protein
VVSKSYTQCAPTIFHAGVSVFEIANRFPRSFFSWAEKNGAMDSSQLNHRKKRTRPGATPGGFSFSYVLLFFVFDFSFCLFWFPFVLRASAHNSFNSSKSLSCSNHSSRFSGKRSRSAAMNSVQAHIPNNGRAFTRSYVAAFPNLYPPRRFSKRTHPTKTNVWQSDVSEGSSGIVLRNRSMGLLKRGIFLLAKRSECFRLHIRLSIWTPPPNTRRPNFAANPLLSCFRKTSYLNYKST